MCQERATGCHTFDTAGCPARPIRSRFSPRVSERLLALAWWDWDHDRLRGALEEFRKLPAEEFLDRHGG